MTATRSVDVTGLLGSTLAPGRPTPLQTLLIFAWRAVLKIKHVPQQLGDVIGVPIVSTFSSLTSSVGPSPVHPAIPRISAPRHPCPRRASGHHVHRRNAEQ
jgi:hypothetical protein